MDLDIAESGSRVEMKRRRRESRRKKTEALSISDDINLGCSKGDSLMKNMPVEKDSYVESAVGISSGSDLIKGQSDSNLDCSQSNKKRKRTKDKTCNVPKTENTDTDLPEDASKAKIAPLTSLEAPVDMSKKTVSETAPVEAQVLGKSDSNLVCSQNKKNRKKKKGMTSSAPKIENTDTDVQEDASKPKIDPLTSTETPVDMSKKTVSETAPVEAQVLGKSDSDLVCSQNKKNRKKKGMMSSAPKIENTDTDVQEDASKPKIDPLMSTETPVDMSKETVLETAPIEVQVLGKSDSNLVCSQNKKNRKKKKGMTSSAPKIENTDTDVQEDASKPKIDPLTSTETPVDMSKKTVSETAPVEAQVMGKSNSNLVCSQNKKNRKKKKGMTSSAPKIENTDTDVQEDASKPKIDPLTSTETPVDMSKETVLESAPIEVQVLGKSDSNLVCSQDKKKRKKEGKTSSAPKIENTDTDVQEDASKPKIAPLTSTETPVDMSKETVLESAPIEVQVLGDVSTKMDSPPAPVKLSKSQRQKREKQMKKKEKIGVLESAPIEVQVLDDASTKMDSPPAPMKLTKSQRRSLRKQEKKKEMIREAHALYLRDHVLLGDSPVIKNASPEEDNSVTKNASAVRDLSLQPPVSICSKNDSVMKQSNAGIFCMEKNERKEQNEGHIASGNTSTGKIQLANGNHFEKEDVKFSPGASELFSTSTKKDFLISEERHGSPKSANTNLMEEHDFDDVRDLKTYKRKRKAEGYCRKKSRKSSDSVEIRAQDTARIDGVYDESSSDPKEEASSHLGVRKDDVDVDLDGAGKKDDLSQTLQPSPERACICHSKKKLLVLDVNGLLADIVPYADRKPDIVVSRKYVFKRPYCDDFLQFCFERFNVGVWSSRLRSNVERAISFLLGDLRHKLLFCWDASQCTTTGFKTIKNRDKPLVLKELKKLWEKHEPGLPWEKGEYNERNTLLLDDSPYKALRNPAHTAIYPYSYNYMDAKDFSLGPGGDLRVYLEGLADADNVQEYVRRNPFGQPALTESDPYWSFYSKEKQKNPWPPYCCPADKRMMSSCNFKPGISWQ